jgi:hypothetical protein
MKDCETKGGNEDRKDRNKQRIKGRRIEENRKEIRE